MKETEIVISKVNDQPGNNYFSISAWGSWRADQLIEALEKAVRLTKEENLSPLHHGMDCPPKPVNRVVYASSDYELTGSHDFPSMR